MEEYKGIYYGDNDSEQKFYEGGAHFPYIELYNKLEILLKNQETHSKEKQYVQRGKTRNKQTNIYDNTSNKSNNLMNKILTFTNKHNKEKSISNISNSNLYSNRNNNKKNCRNNLLDGNLSNCTKIQNTNNFKENKNRKIIHNNFLINMRNRYRNINDSINGNSHIYKKSLLNNCSNKIKIDKSYLSINKPIVGNSKHIRIKDNNLNKEALNNPNSLQNEKNKRQISVDFLEKSGLSANKNIMKNIRSIIGSKLKDKENKNEINNILFNLKSINVKICPPKTSISKTKRAYDYSIKVKKNNLKNKSKNTSSTKTKSEYLSNKVDSINIYNSNNSIIKNKNQSKNIKKNKNLSCSNIINRLKKKINNKNDKKLTHLNNQINPKTIKNLKYKEFSLIDALSERNNYLKRIRNKSCNCINKEINLKNITTFSNTINESCISKNNVSIISNIKSIKKSRNNSQSNNFSFKSSSIDKKVDIKIKKDIKKRTINSSFSKYNKNKIFNFCLNMQTYNNKISQNKCVQGSFNNNNFTQLYFKTNNSNSNYENKLIRNNNKKQNCGTNRIKKKFNPIFNIKNNFNI